VFEVRGTIGAFAAAVRNVPGLELIDEEELETDHDDKAPVAYLMVPDIRALRDLESLWRRSQRGELLRGETPWRDVFALLRDLRTWGPADRIQLPEVDILSEQIVGRNENDPIKLEVELVYRANEDVAVQREAEAGATVIGLGGRIVSRSRIGDIAYHALLVDLPVRAVRRIVERSPDSIAGLDSVMHIRPQSIASSIELSDPVESVERVTPDALGEPILALLDGVPVAAHPSLAAHIVVDDQFGLEPDAPVADRVHGTAMASLIVHGDQNKHEPTLPRRIHVVPVLGARDEFSEDRLIVDVIYTAILAMRAGPGATARNVVIVNVSLGNPRRPFYGQLSPWARLLDRLAYRFGLLFIVSAGNHGGEFAIEAFASHEQFEDAAPDVRAAGTLRGLGAIIANRRLFSPAETVNGLTIGACNHDAVADVDRLAAARVNVDPYGELPMPNPSSALGPGFALSVKPDFLMPGAREHLRFVRTHPLEVRPTAPARSAGLRVAAPPRAGRENSDGYTNGTSAAAALASRTAHRIHDALEDAYGADFNQLSLVQRAVLLKALLAHPARWPEESAALIRQTIGPPEGKYHARQKDNIRRFLGYGLVDGEDAVACSVDRATFWATGALQPNKVVDVLVPVPHVMSGQALPHTLSATLAWFTPIAAGRKSYRSVRLKLLEPEELAPLAVVAHGNQPDGNQTNRGTLFTRCWSGDRAPAIGQDTWIQLTVQRDPDQGLVIDDAVPFGLAVTLAMPGVETIYEQVRQRLAIVPRAPV
jgi:hypothetical protein